MQSEESKHIITIKFDTDIYSVQAVKYAIFDLDIAANIFKAEYNNKMIHVEVLSTKDSAFTLNQKICNAVLEHQIRIDVEKDFGAIRKLILAQAFFPCENLDHMLDGIDL